jgi:glycosyltransferase involved in cell wall biosynthesis
VVQVKGQRIHPDSEPTIAFLFSRRIAYPPDIHNLKTYYISKEAQKRGARVNWVQVGERGKKWDKDGIRFAVFSAPKGAHLPEALRLARRDVECILQLGLYCAVDRIRIVYADEWLFLRQRPFARLMCQMILRIMGVKLVLDQRDPFVDFEIAAGEVKEGTMRHRWLTWVQSLIVRQTDLIVLPSVAYSALYESEGVPKGKVLGKFRGIDSDLFKPQLAPNATRSQLGLGGKFVVGWFGIMHSFRMIREIIVPLIENLSKEMPNAHVLIGGEGPLMDQFERLRRSEARESFTLLGAIPYDNLPDYMAACDVTICPVSTDFRFTENSNWLKIAESIAVGTPVVATKTNISDLDYRNVRGVVWADSNYQAFLDALKNSQAGLESLHTEAVDQANHFEAYSIESTIPRIVDRVLGLVQSL